MRLLAGVATGILIGEDAHRTKTKTPLSLPVIIALGALVLWSIAYPRYRWGRGKHRPPRLSWAGILAAVTLLPIALVAVFISTLVRALLGFDVSLLVKAQRTSLVHPGDALPSRACPPAVAVRRN